jgi:hypothetical protein
VRVLAVMAAAGALLAGTACGGPAGAVAARTDAASAPASRQPAAVAGGACQLLDYDVVAAAIGANFAIAASGTNGATFTCVLQPSKGSLPDLSLAVTATEADPYVFRSSVVPKGATVIEDLGKVGYRLPVAAGAGTGPGLEIGWLSANQRLMVMRYRAAAGTAGTDLDALVPKLVDLANKIDMATD